MVAQAQPAGIDKAEVKSLLNKSKKEPVNFAFGSGSDASSALLAVSKIKAGPALVKVMEAQDTKANNARFGRALVDVDDNPKLVKFYVNKPVSGMAKRLVRSLKGTGFNKVEILLDDGTMVEAFSEEDDAPAAAASGAAAAPPPPPPPAPPPPAPAAARPDPADLAKQLAEQVKRMPAAIAADPGLKDTLAKLATDANVNIKTNNLTYAATYIAQLQTALDNAASTAPAAPSAAAAPPPPPPPGPPPVAAAARDPAALARLLAEQAKRIPGVLATTPGLKDSLTKLATDANVNIKTNNLTYAATYIEQLRRALDSAAAPAAAPVPPAAPAVNGSKVAYAKSRLAWLAARQKIEAELAKLRSEIIATYKDAGNAPEVEKLYTARVAPILATLDERLADKLDEAMNAADATVHRKLVGEAKTIISEYSTYVDGEPLIGDLDENPFVPLAIRNTLTTTLSGLSKAIV